MKSVYFGLFALLVFNPPPASAAGVSMKTLAPYGRYQIEADQTELTLVLSTVVHTCKENMGFLGGELKKVEVPQGTYTSVQQVIADIQVLTPLMICRTAEQDFNVSREATFKSLPNMKFINLDIWVPSNVAVSVK